MFQWLLIHKGLAVGAWYKGSAGDRGCSSCGEGLETQQHCLWECVQAQGIWQRILRLLAREGVVGLFSWGTAAWASLATKVVTYESTTSNTALYTNEGRVHITFLLPYAGQVQEEEGNPMWELLCGITLWVIWKGRCIKVFTGKQVPPAEGIQEIWSEAVHTLKGQYDNIQGDNDIAIRREQKFILKLSRTHPLCTLVGTRPQWKFSAPIRLFPPPS